MVRETRSRVRAKKPLVKLSVKLVKVGGTGGEMVEMMDESRQIGEILGKLGGIGEGKVSSKNNEIGQVVGR